MGNNRYKRWTSKEDDILIKFKDIKTYKEIGKILNRTHKSVERRVSILRKKGVLPDWQGTNQYGTYKERENKFKERFESMYPDFEYHSGYKTVDDYFKSKCKICGYIQERHGQCTRPRNKDTDIICDNCEEIKRKKKKRQREIERIQRLEQTAKEKLLKILKHRIDSLEREKLLQKTCTRCGRDYQADRIDNVYCNRCIAELNQEAKEKEKMWRNKVIRCVECGEEFEMKSSKSKYCSEKCLNRAMSRIQEIRKRKRIKQNGRIDYGVTLTKLIKRDKNICQICGQACDEQDYTLDRERNFIAGELYPSIDHIIPVSKGGTHTWDNVQLAHHYCNSIKNDNIYSTVESNGQLRII